MTKKADDMLDIASRCVEIAKKKGASDASAVVGRQRQVELAWREGKADRISEATTRRVSLQLFVDGRYASVSTSDLRPDALPQFIEDSIALARALEKDPHRRLPEPELYKGQASIDLAIEDPAYEEFTPEKRRALASEMEKAAKASPGHERLLTVETSVSDTLNEFWAVTSNGFTGKRRDTVFFVSTSVSVKDDDGRRPEDFAYAGSRFHSKLPSAAGIGRDAVARALARLGSKKIESAEMPMVLDARTAGRMASYLVSALYASSLQQKRSYFDGKLGKKVASDALTIVDDPHILSAFGSRLFDNEGIAANKRVIFEKGTLRNYYIDNYYGRKLALKPNGGSVSNLDWSSSGKSQQELIAQVKNGILVTSFLGGNSNSLTGDFSLGVAGFRIVNGRQAEPVSEMNISGNHTELWKKLVEVGNDPFPYSSFRTPTLVFDAVSFAGV